MHKLPQAYAPATLELLNRLFRYDKLGDRYDFPVVFFEESYPCDGVDIGDVALLDRVAKLVGKENVLVKIHPRNQVNRFALAGYRTNQDTSVPWELVALNHSFAGTVFLTVGSSAATNPWCVLAFPPRRCFCGSWWRSPPSCGGTCWSRQSACARQTRSFSSAPRPGRNVKGFFPGWW